MSDLSLSDQTDFHTQPSFETVQPKPKQQQSAITTRTRSKSNLLSLETTTTTTNSNQSNSSNKSKSLKRKASSTNSLNQESKRGRKSSSRKLRSSTLKKSSNNNNNNTIDNNIKLKRKRKMSSKSRSTRKDSSKIEKKKTIPSVDTSSESCDSNEDSFQSAESPFDPLARRTETSLSSSASQAFSKKMPTKTAPPHPADNRHTSTNNNSSVPKQPPTTDTDSQAPNDPERQRRVESFFSSFGIQAQALPTVLRHESLTSFLNRLESGDEGAAFDVLADLSSALAMATEDVLSRVDINLLCRALNGSMLSMAHNGNILLLAVRCVCHLLEALPGSATALIRQGVIPNLCAPLKAIEYMDVAEQCLVALHVFSQQAAAQLLNVDVLPSLLAFLDFFAASAQHHAVATAAALCARAASPGVFQRHIAPSLPILRNLLSHHDSFVVSKALQCFSSLVNHHCNDVSRRAMLMGEKDSLAYSLIALFNQQLNSKDRHLALSTLTKLLRCDALLCVRLVQSDQIAISELVGESLRAQQPHEAISPLRTASQPAVLGSSPSNTTAAALSSNNTSASEVYQWVSLADALLPPLPADVALPFASLNGDRTASDPRSTVSRTRWRAPPGRGASLPVPVNAAPPPPSSSAPLATPTRRSSRKSSNTPAATTTVAAAAVTTPPPSNAASKAGPPDARQQLFADQPALLAQLGRRWLGTLMLVYGNNINEPVRVRCIEVITKLLYHSPSTQLDQLLKDVAISAFIAGLLASRSAITAQAGVQLASIAIDKLPRKLPTYYRKEGVLHGLRVLADGSTPSKTRSTPKSLKSAPKSTASRDQSFEAARQAAQTLLQRRFTRVDDDTHASALAKAAQTIGTAQVNDGVTDTALDTLVQAVCEGVSPFEFREAGVVAALLAFVSPTKKRTAGDVATRVRKLMHALARVDGAAQTLVGQLQHCVTRNADLLPLRRVTLKTNNNTVDDDGSSGAVALTRLIGVLLRPTKDSEMSKKLAQSLSPLSAGNANIVAKVMVEPLASVGAVAMFLQERLEHITQSSNENKNLDKNDDNNNDDDDDDENNEQDVDEDEEIEEDDFDEDEDEDERADVESRSSLPASMRNRQRRQRRQPFARRIPQSIEFDVNDEDINRNLSSIMKIKSDIPKSKFEIKLFYQGKELDSNNTLLRALIGNVDHDEEENEKDFNLIGLKAASLWSTHHELTFDVVENTKEKQQNDTNDNNDNNSKKSKQSSSTSSTSTKQTDPSMKHSEDQEIVRLFTIARNATSAESIAGAPEAMSNSLRLLTLLNQLPSNAGVSENEFENTRLDVTFRRQLAESLLLAGALLPRWCVALANAPCRVLPLNSRELFFRGNCLGASRAVTASIAARGANSNVSPVNTASSDGERNSASNGVSALEHVKARVRRDAVLAGAQRALATMGSTRAIVEFEFIGEVGTGLGPTSEFYTLVSHALSKRTDMWRVDAQGEIIRPLFPRVYAPDQLPLNVKSLFVFIGRLFARALLDQRLLQLELAEPLLAPLVGEMWRGTDALPLIDATTNAGLVALKCAVEEKNAEMIEDLDLDFTMVGENGWSLIKDSKSSTKSVTLDNALLYIELLSEAIAGSGVAEQLTLMRRGFDEVLPHAAPLRMFDASELARVLCGAGEAEAEWTREQVLASIHPDHGFTRDSRVVAYVVDALVSFNAHERRAFVQFCTGGGGGRLPAKLTVARKDVGAEPDQYLPSVNTCFVYIKLPDYSCAEVTKAKLRYAMLNAREFTFN